MAAFAPALRNQPSLDDVRQVERYSPPEGAAGWLALPAEPWWPVDHENFVWRPLARITIALQKAMHPGAMAPFYAFNVLLHALVAMLLVVAARRLGFSAGAAWAAGAIFAVHPAHAEAVHQIVGRTELLSAGAMLAGIAWLARDGVSPATRWRQPLVFALALGGKENAVVYPVIVALLLGDAATRAGSGPAPRGAAARAFAWPRGGTVVLVLLAITGVAWLAAKGAVTGGLLEGGGAVPRHENVLARMGFAGRLPAVVGILGYTVAHLVVPAGLAPDYSARSLPLDAGLAWPWMWAGAAMLAAGLTFAIRDARHGGRAWRFLVAGLVSWGVTSNGPFPIGVAVAERLWLWPSAFVAVGLGWAMDRGGGFLDARVGDAAGRWILPVATGALVVTFWVASWSYASAWRSPYDLAHATLARFPDSWRSHVNLARQYYDRKQYESGRRHGRAAVQVDPRHTLSWQAVGLNAMFLGGGSREAEDAFRRALSLDPREGEVHRYLANVLEMRGETSAAAAELEAYLAWPEARDREVLQPRLERLRAGGGTP